MTTQQPNRCPACNAQLDGHGVNIGGKDGLPDEWLCSTCAETVEDACLAQEIKDGVKDLLEGAGITTGNA